MKTKLKLLSLVLVLTLNVSCVEKESGKKSINKSELIDISLADTLKFTSGIRSIFQDSKGSYWFGSLQEGVAVYNGKSFSYFDIKDGLTDNQIHSIQEDKNGTIWFNTQNGLSSYDGEKITNHTKLKEEIPQGKWMKLENDFWFEAGIKEGVFRFDGQNINYLAFPIHKVLNPYDNLFAVTDISNGMDNMIWFATYAGVFGYNGTDFTIINDETLGLDRKKEPLHIRSILEDSKGRLWIGNNGIGVLLREGDSTINFSEKNNLIHPSSSRNGDPSMPGTLEHVFTIAEDNNGNIWFGDRDTGVWKYDGVTMVNYSTNDGLENDFVLSIFEDEDKKLWFGTLNGDVYQFNGKSFEKQF